MSDDNGPHPHSTELDRYRELGYPSIDDAVMYDDDVPPSTQPRPPNWGVPSITDIRPATPVDEPSMEQFICFVFRGNAVCTYMTYGVTMTLTVVMC